ncbi:MAG: SRPBCC domain-containing protein [Bacteroidota bacterium]
MNSQKKQFSIVREFNASKQKVFNAFSTAEAMEQWWGPAGMNIIVSSFDFSPNGKFHYKMEAGDNVMWGLFVFKTIINPDVIEFVNSFSDEDGNIAKPPFDMDFPLEIFNRLTFEETNGITKVTLQGHPINATDNQEAVYHSITDSMIEGFGGTFDKLDAYLLKR